MKAMPFSVAVAGAAVMAFAAPAQAAYIMLNDGSPYSEVVHANSAGSGTDLTTITSPGSLTVYLSSPDGLDVGNGNGVAIVTGDSGTQSGFSILAINPVDPFSVMQFKIEDFGGKSAAGTLDILVNFVGGGSELFSAFALPANSKLDVFADIGEQLDSILLLNLKTDAGEAVLFKDVKQISFDPASAVPEPATWAMMILGMGAVGLTLRRRTTRVSFS